MTFSLEFSKEFTRTFSKLQKKDQKQVEIILKKIREIKENPEHFKPLSNQLKGYRRVHIDSHFVLAYKVVGQTITIIDYDHHETIYEKLKRKK